METREEEEAAEAEAEKKRPRMPGRRQAGGASRARRGDREASAACAGWYEAGLKQILSVNHLGRLSFFV